MKNILLSLIGLLLFSSCEEEIIMSEQEQQLITIESETKLTSEKRASKINICHYDVKKDRWFVLNVNEKAFTGHSKHGDKLLVDKDGDGYVEEINECVPGGDCDDIDPAVNPGATEVCDGVDNNCDGQIDEVYNIQERLDNGVTPKDLFDCGVPLTDLYGKTYQGGFITHLNTVDGTGVIAAPSNANNSQGIRWYINGNFTITGASGTAIGTGETNTNAIIATLGTGAYAASVCTSYTNGTYFDWYLPSKDELNAMYENLYSKGKGNFIMSGLRYYWSSSEFDSINIWIQIFTSNSQIVYNKSATLNVRAVRAF